MINTVDRAILFADLKSEKRHAVPFEIIKRGDLTLIPIHNHRAQYPNFRPSLPSFIDAIKESDHLIVEGYSQADNKKRRVDPTSFESLAMTTFRNKHSGKDIHFLEEGINWRTLGEKFGIKGDEQVVYRFLKDFYIQAAIDGRMFKPSAFVKKLTDNMTGYNQHDAERLTELFKRTFINFNEAVLKGELSDDDVAKTISVTNRLFTWYFGRLRDYELICPNALDFVTNLKGRKTMIIGSNHIPLIDKVLEGETLSVPEDWPSLVDGLPMIYNQPVATLRRMMEISP